MTSIRNVHINYRRLLFLYISVAISSLRRSVSLAAPIYHTDAFLNNQRIPQMINMLCNRLHATMINRFPSTRPFAFMNRDDAQQRRRKLRSLEALYQ